MKRDNVTDLCDSILKLEKREEVYNFLKDLCTPQEIKALAERWQVCRLLDIEGLSYREIKAYTGASLTTISRVARFLKDESNKGYRVLLDRIKADK